jgi:hypothetical protein
MEAVATPHWDDMSPGDKQAWLLDQALDRKREILDLPMPDADDDSAEATRLRALILALLFGRELPACRPPDVFHDLFRPAPSPARISVSSSLLERLR